MSSGRRLRYAAFMRHTLGHLGGTPRSLGATNSSRWTPLNRTSSMPFLKAQRVKHPGKPDWGIGEVLEDASGTAVRVFFVGAGEKTLSLAHVNLLVVAGVDAVHPVLENLRRVGSGATIRYESLPRVIDRFLELYPQGFYGQKYLEEERDYKVKAHQLATAALGRAQMADLLGIEDYEEVCRRALRASNSTNLIFPNEKMALKDGLYSLKAQRNFAIALYALLHGDAAFEERFKPFADVLLSIGSAKWTVATYFPFIVSPDRHIFIKPTITQKAAELSAFEINYRAELNWPTYRSVMAFANYLRDAIKDLKPRDMIDVQSFMWCIAPEI